MVGEGRRARRTPEQWRALVAEQARSGFGVGAFCRDRGLAASSLRRWKRKLGQVESTPQVPMGFVELAVPRSAPRDEPWDVELDLGAGIGRFSHAWLERDWNVTLCDPNAAALVLALSHLAPLNGRFAIHHLAAENIAPLPDNHFHAVSAMEVFCYLSNPRDGMAEAARVLQPGGWLFASVESPIGSLEPHVRHSREAIDEALTRDRLEIEHDTWVRYFTPDTLKQTMESVGLRVDSVIGTHYLPDGPMHHLVDVSRLGESDYESALIELEHQLQDSAKWKDAARAWVVVAQKPT